jgi:3-oxoadipate enol-lactonase
MIQIYFVGATGYSGKMLSSINGVNLYHTEAGNGQSLPVLLVHGFPFSSEMWKSQTELLQKNGFRALSYDLRGHGKSDFGDGQYTIELFVDDLVSLLEHLKITKVVLCGFSMGGYVALRAMERNPERFSALVLCDTTSTSDSNEARLRRAAAIKTVKKDGVKMFAEGFLKAVFSKQSITSSHDAVGAARKMILSNSPTGICGALLAMAGRTDTTESLAKINVPTLILVGQHDTITPPAAAKSMHERIKNSKMHIIENAAHMSCMENPVQFNDYLIKFLKGVII